MRIVLDTNIVLAAGSLTSSRFRILAEYSKKNLAGFVMPRIVYAELYAKRSQHISKAERTYREAAKALRDVTRLTGPISEMSVDTDSEAKQYLEMVCEALGCKNEEIRDYPQSYLENVLDRAIWRKAPCSLKGEEIRDAILWLEVLDEAESSADKSVIFISNDTDFGGASGLLEDLRRETEKRNVTVQYFSSLEAFAKEHAATISFISREWIQERISTEEILDAADHIIGKLAISRTQGDYGYWGVTRTPTGWFQRTNYQTLDLENFFANELESGEVRIEATYRGEVEVECEVEVTRVNPWIDEDDGENEFSYQPTMGRVRTKTEMDTIVFEVVLGIEIFVEGESIRQWRLIPSV